MSHSQFDQFLAYALNRITDTLASKSAEYSSDGNKFSNFEDAARISDETPIKALDGMALKHYVSYRKILKDYNRGGILPSKELLEEKMIDNINYMLLQWGQIVEHLGINVYDLNSDNVIPVAEPRSFVADLSNPIPRPKKVAVVEEKPDPGNYDDPFGDESDSTKDTDEFPL